MNIDLTAKNILVTGASRGIGKVIAEQLLRSGARVAAHYNSTEVKFGGLSENELRNLSVFKADLTDIDQSARLLEDVIERFGHLDVIINNAGIALKSEVEKPVSEFASDWQTTCQ